MSSFGRVPRVSSADVRGRHSERARVESADAASSARALRAAESSPRAAALRISVDRDERLGSIEMPARRASFSAAERRSRACISNCCARSDADS
jgi:hypothetical protein